MDAWRFGKSFLVYMQLMLCEKRHAGREDVLPRQLMEVVHAYVKQQGRHVIFASGVSPLKKYDNNEYCKIYACDTAVGEWTEIAHLGQALSNRKLAVLTDRSIMVTGGCYAHYDGHGPLREMGNPACFRLVYSRATGKYDKAPVESMQGGRRDNAVAVFHNGLLMSCGGHVHEKDTTDVIETYSAFTFGWAKVNTLPKAVINHSATALWDWRVLIAGGTTAGGRTDECCFYNPVTNAVTPCPPLSTPRSNHGACLMPDGRVIVTGGMGVGRTPLSSTEIYNPVMNEWTAGPELWDTMSINTCIAGPEGPIVICRNKGGLEWQFLKLPEMEWSMTRKLGLNSVTEWTLCVLGY